MYGSTPLGSARRHQEQSMDIEGASPSTLGRHRRIEGKDYMATADIEGARSRYLINQEKKEVRARESAASGERSHEYDSKYQVKDIN